MQCEICDKVIPHEEKHIRWRRAEHPTTKHTGIRGTLNICVPCDGEYDRPNLTCQVCDKTFGKIASLPSQFCSYECQAKHLSKVAARMRKLERTPGSDAKYCSPSHANNSVTTMTKNDSKRKLLKSIAAGSGAVVAGKSLPESWSKPVVDAVMLPVHAATTDDTGSGGPEATTTQGCCLIAGTYCDTLGDLKGYLEIIVATDGSITVIVHFDGVHTLTDTIPCTGGNFTARNSDHTVTGTVGCSATSISGTANLYDNPGVNYDATVDGCPS